MKLKDIFPKINKKDFLDKAKIIKKKTYDYIPFEETDWENKETLSKFSAGQIYCKRMININTKILKSLEKDLKDAKELLKRDNESNIYSDIQKKIDDTKDEIDFWKKQLKKADADAETSDKAWDKKGAYAI